MSDAQAPPDPCPDAPSAKRAAPATVVDSYALARRRAAQALILLLSGGLVVTGVYAGPLFIAGAVAALSAMMAIGAIDRIGRERPVAKPAGWIVLPFGEEATVHREPHDVGYPERFYLQISGLDGMQAVQAAEAIERHRAEVA